MNDSHIQQQIDALSEKELRGVVKYLLLLNAEAVENALNYTYQQRPPQSTEDSFDDKFSSEFADNNNSMMDQGDDSAVLMDPNQEEDDDHHLIPIPASDMPPLLNKESRRSQSINSGMDDDDDALPPATSSPARPRSMNVPMKTVSSSDSTDSTATPLMTNQASSKAFTSKPLKLTLVILCTMKPPSNQQAIDQDDAMVFCKHIGVMPTIVLVENKPDKTKQLLDVSKDSSNYPQFFLYHDASYEYQYLGSLDLMRQWKKQGKLTTVDDFPNLWTLKEDQPSSDVAETPAPTQRQLTFDEQEEVLGEGSPFSAIPEHLQSKQQEQKQPPASDLYHHLLNLAGPRSRSSLGQHATPTKPRHEEDSIDNDIPGPLEPPEGGHAVLQDKNNNRREEPPAQSPPRSTKKALRAQRNGTENELVQDEDLELSTTEPAAPATPNRNAQLVNTSEPPALSPPMTTAKAQRRVQQEGNADHAPSTPNAQAVKKYHQDEVGKPEPTPGGGALRKDVAPLEPPEDDQPIPSTKEVVVVVTAPEKEVQPVPVPSSSEPIEEATDETAKYIPESPMAVEKKNDAEISSIPADIIPVDVVQQEPTRPPSPADDQVLSILNGVGACYLIYDDDTLNIYYSETPMDHAVGVWSSTDITDFKEAQGLGEKEFIGNCATDCQSTPAN